MATQTAQSERNDGMQPQPELLMAARHGDREQLMRLLVLGRTVALASSQLPADEVVVHVEEEAGCVLPTVEDAEVTPADAVTVGLDSVLHV
uniref:Uncharacterized protein n=2 Tax=Oryza brachyantha TaxID=4533 RepID=J3MWL9_ORYBR